MNFKDLNLHPSLLKALEELGYEVATQIQEIAIPQILKKSDICASAQTGTGKTAAFLLPALQQMLNNPNTKGPGPRLLILVPTRELAMQVAQEASKLSQYIPRLKTVCLYGGAPYPAQIRDLSRPYEILVATPGRLIDHLERGRIQFNRLEMLVLDEADRMLDMGFIHPVEKIAAMTPKNRQTLLFSATLRGSVLKLSKKLLNNPFEIKIAPDHAKHDNITQHLLYVDNYHHKQQALDVVLKDTLLNQAIVFTATKRQAKELLENLLDQGHKAAALHGDMNQSQRTRTIGRMRKGDVRILVATDVAARGIDITTITHVINFDMPGSGEDYVHRIGRTGRAGATGTAHSFAGPRDRYLIRQIEQFTGQKLVPHILPGLECAPRFERKTPRPPFRNKERNFKGFRKN